jgi:hypothetical protein
MVHLNSKVLDLFLVHGILGIAGGVYAVVPGVSSQSRISGSIMQIEYSPNLDASWLLRDCHYLTVGREYPMKKELPDWRISIQTLRP